MNYSIKAKIISIYYSFILETRVVGVNNGQGMGDG
jgi:hypothetical protein